METTRSSWLPCFCDSWRGVAHFDGLTIEADPITSARPNRVLPCIEDEQVLFCRMVEAILGKEGAGKIAIDLGTGSGVLALHAAARLGINVTGVDCCKRAIAFAEHNKERNKAALGAASGNVTFKHESYPVKKKGKDSENSREWIETSQFTADYVFLNAPFSPELQDTKLPVCANGGQDGQNAFLSAVSAAHKLLKDGGRLFVIHLLLTDAVGEPLHKLIGGDPGSPRWSSMRLFPVLSEPPIPVADFLAKECRDQPKNFEPLAQDSASRFFSFCFLEFTKGEETGTIEATIVPRDEFPLGATPAWTWDERLTWHRAVLENTSPEAPESSAKEEHLALGDSALPSIALFLDRSHAPLDRNNESKDPALSATQAILNRWIRRNGLLSPQSDSLNPSFDCIMVESAPWHPAQRRLELRTETAIWSRNDYSHQESSVSAQEAPVAKALVRILHEIKHINNKKRSVFRHPALEEGGEHRLWQHAIFSVFRENDPEASARIAASTDLVGPQEKPHSTDKKPVVTHSKNAATYLHPLQNFDIGEKNPSTTPLETCIAAALHAYTGICRQEGLLGEGDATCYFCSLPLPSPQPHSPAGTSGTLYVYGWSTHPWSPIHETAIADLARAAGALYEEQYTEATRFELQTIERSNLISSAAHEIEKLIKTIGPKMTSEYAALLQDYFRLHLELLPLGATFSGPSSDLQRDAKRGISRLAELSYLYRVICEERPDPLSVTLAFMEQKINDSRALIQTDDGLNGLRMCDIKPEAALHFTAAFVAGLRNAISHCKKLGRTEQRIRVTVQDDAIVIVNHYVSDSSDRIDRAGLADKKNNNLPGTESVLQHHERQVRGSLSYRGHVSSIKKKGCEVLGNGRFRHEWETRIALPASSTNSISS